MGTSTTSIFGISLSLRLPWRRMPRAAVRHARPDAATLRDLGLHSSEWESINAEATGRAAVTRRRVALEGESWPRGA
jgi:hypothetical protein